MAVYAATGRANGEKREARCSLAILGIFHGESVQGVRHQPLGEAGQEGEHEQFREFDHIVRTDDEELKTRRLAVRRHLDGFVLSTRNRGRPISSRRCWSGWLWVSPREPRQAWCARLVVGFAFPCFRQWFFPVC